MKGQNAIKNRDIIIAEYTIRKWYARFRRWAFYLEHRERFRRLALADDDQI